MDRKNIKCLGLLSGGLDSNIAVRLMVKLGYDVTVLNFMSPFCNCTRKQADSCKSTAHRIAEEMGLPIKTLFMGEEYINMLRAPKHGFGQGLNPCVDCRIMMFSQTKKVMEEMGAKFIFTGEVLSQRPMSQKRDRLAIIEREAGLKGLIVRPLSAALLEPTIPEKEGWINREEMLAISGRSRKPQVEVGRELGIDEENLCSSGGCLLTDQQFAVKMRDLLGHSTDTTVKETRMLRVGRHFRVSDTAKVIVGRNNDENEKLLKMIQGNDTVIWVKDHKGPCVVIQGAHENGVTATACMIAARYSDAPAGAEVEVEVGTAAGAEKEIMRVQAISDERLAAMRM